MLLTSPIQVGEYVPSADQRIIMYGIEWSRYGAQLELRGETSVPRVNYLEGVMELMSPSKEHERIKSYIGRLIDAYALERNLELSPYGSWTLKKAPQRVGVEPDECYILGSDQSKDAPDLAIEVIWTSGGIDKLEAYRRLRIAEVWFWKEGAIEINVLCGERYERRANSGGLPGLDVDLLASFLDAPTAIQAVKDFRTALRSAG